MLHSNEQIIILSDADRLDNVYTYPKNKKNTNFIVFYCNFQKDTIHLLSNYKNERIMQHILSFNFYCITSV